ncbi:MAG: hypothetical protein JO246_16805 [Frankiaceae bacterium]|nr:hypothetical protein [Frankiaceae bacterium]MBV9872276.1 hypothetical protein [Frankiaceae bacterium]
MGIPQDRAACAVLGREWLLHGHLQDRLGMALVMEKASREEMQEVAIDEWMAASPIYSARMQRAMSFAGDGVDTILKNLQLDIGAPHEFMDFKFRLLDRDHGEFWLAHCGALMDVEPMGVEFVHGMCHAIEDPTFDATAGATNPLAQVRPLHRPPRVPANRTPHCHWRVDIVAGQTEVEPHANQALVDASRIATLDRPSVPADGEEEGMRDYSGQFVTELRLEDFSVSAQHVLLHEFAVQSHLLLRSLLVTVSRRWGSQFARQLVPRLTSGWAAVTAQRLKAAFDLGDDAAGLAGMLQLHPIFHPDSYVALHVAVEDDQTVRFGFGVEAVAALEADDFTWFSQLGGAMDDALERIIQGFNPCATVRAITPGAGELHAYRAVIDPTATPAAEFAELAIAKITTGAAFRFAQAQAKLLPTSGGLV